MTLEFFVPGIPRPGGSKTATVVRRKGGEIVFKNGRPLVAMRDDAKGNANWKSTVADFAHKAMASRDLLAGPLCVVIEFRMSRLGSHYGSGRNAGVLKPNAPTYHTVKPDATKLMRSTEDALTGIVWRDDAAIAHQQIRKVYADKPGAFIRVYEIDDVSDRCKPVAAVGDAPQFPLFEGGCA